MKNETMGPHGASACSSHRVAEQRCPRQGRVLLSRPRPASGVLWAPESGALELASRPQCAKEGPEAPGHAVSELQSHDSNPVSLPGPVTSVQPQGPSLRGGEGRKWPLSSLPLPVLSLSPEETSDEEGMTRPSRGQCDAGHVIPPLSLSPSHLSPRILLMGAKGRFPHPHCHRGHCRGGRGPLLGRNVLSLPLPLPLAQPPPQALVHLLLLFLWPHHSWPGRRWSCVRPPPPHPLEGSPPLHPICFVFHVTAI